jgi:hypothetical protein
MRVNNANKNVIVLAFFIGGFTGSKIWLVWEVGSCEPEEWTVLLH